MISESDYICSLKFIQFLMLFYTELKVQSEKIYAEMFGQISKNVVLKEMQAD